ncbi:Hin recombinase [Solihabitans fulvus]|uniref:Hin recombinase n=1 Tax=Solihabitans fulvus TaxID=1892852 RepID=A0A5B2WA41_9PSEU|nr:Hin recombinase [Solihabitans fulvus]KAA2247177.1 Hin recombinase [Solihabitans fulvus]
MSVLPGDPFRACPHCGHRPAGRREARQLCADTTVTWLEPGPDGTLGEAHHCTACAPTGPVIDLACDTCGDGPLLCYAARSPSLSDLLAAARRWLCALGWQATGRCLTCPACRRAAPGPSTAR